MNLKSGLPILCGLIMLSGVHFSASALSGTVVDKDSVGIKGAVIMLVKANLSDTSGDNGAWDINVPSAVQPILRKQQLPQPVLIGNLLNFVVSGESELVRIRVYSINGRFLYDVVNSRLSAGFYRINPIRESFGSGMYSVLLQVGTVMNSFRLLSMNSMTAGSGLVYKCATDRQMPGQLEKRTVVIDTLKVSKAGYIPLSVPVTSYDAVLRVVLEVFVPSYHLNPPNPCYNQFFVKDCVKGDPNSACKGNCTVANSCSPPEDQSKSNLPKTFICPRFMLFSSEMLQAAKDDAKLYGWGDGSDAPFTYGVVGHDADVGGVDDQESSCCQCYQIIFVKAEPSSPQPPDLPYPKPLIVQSFNTAASGPKGFDVFMGAGGYGAFNSCYKDPAFSNTSKFDEFIYDKFPYQNPGSGGISFLRYPEECRKTWPPTVEDLESAPCQEKIRELCNQALVNASEQVTEDTRRSCIETNKPASLYHQNWEVMVKRVRCPDNLTRVTGCRLKEEKLPLPSPDVKTPDDAKKNGTFRDGYHTTTMQDCCKPTCAWADWVSGKKLPADGEWNSFYSCDKNGVPITKP
ncbi:MAG TPA: hypothetical protein VHO70_15655 [Chitinispirillaceae bacterium]|nr:hypothetical protein [Chitinispirillaceae bacterium]